MSIRTGDADSGGTPTPGDTIEHTATIDNSPTWGLPGEGVTLSIVTGTGSSSD